MRLRSAVVLWYMVAALMMAGGIVAAPVEIQAGPTCSGCG